MSELPAGWRWTTIGEVAETALGKMLDRGHARGHEQVRYLRNVNVQWGRVDTHDLRLMEVSDEDRVRFAVEPGDILVCEGGEIGRAAIWRGDGSYIAYQKALHRIRLHPDADPLFLRYLLEAYAVDGTLDRFSTGSTIAHLPQQGLRVVPVPLPPRDEQRRIVEVLEEHLSRLDAAAASVVSVIPQRLDALRFRLVRNRLNVEADEVSLSDLLSVSIGGVWGAIAGEDEVDVDVIRVTEMLPFGELRESGTRRSITRRQLERRALQPGDLLLEKSGGGPKAPVGRVGLVRAVPRQTVCSNFMQLMRPRAGLSPRYLHLLLNNFYESGGTGSMQKASTSIRNIKSSDYLELRFPVPSLAKQLRIVAEVEPALVAIEALRRETRLASQRNQLLRVATLRAAISGQLAGRSSDHDRIEELVP